VSPAYGLLPKCHLTARCFSVRGYVLTKAKGGKGAASIFGGAISRAPTPAPLVRGLVIAPPGVRQSPMN
jgi:hypothetical protein